MILRDCTAALIPAHNDAYTLRFCLAALAGHVDEAVVFDDCSCDETADVVLTAKRIYGAIALLRHDGDQLGWVGARRELLGTCDARHVFMLDADDVLSDLHAGMLRSIAADADAPWVHLQLCELFGDLRHSTGRYHHYDPCHVYFDRRWAPGLTWGDRPAGGNDQPAGMPAGARPSPSPGPLFFHLKDVKPDARIVERSVFRKWLRADRATGNSSDFAGLDCMTAAEGHRRAVEFLLTSKIDHPARTWDDAGEPLPTVRGAPPLPGLLRSAPQRLRFIYDETGRIVDRLDEETGL